MLRQLQKKFILAAMAAFFLVISLIAVGIVLWNWNITTRMQDSTLDEIRRFESRPSEPFSSFRPSTPFSFMEPDPEAMYTTRFFSVILQDGGETESVSISYIGSVDEETAGRYAAQAAEEQRDRGYIDNFRYLRYEESGRTHIIFLNCAAALQNTRSIVLISAIVGGLSLILVFVLVTLFSARATLPYRRTLERQKQFITDAGHELKTPLTSISTSADVLEAELEGDEWVANIRQQVRRMSRLVSDLVTLSRLDEEVPLPEKHGFSLSDAAWEIAEPFQKQARARNLALNLSIEEGLNLFGDRASIQQLISILLDNAVRYSPEGQAVDFTVTSRHGHAVIAVANSYDGPALDTARIFDRFYRPDEARSRDTGGHGIGLSIAKAVTEAHSGHITAISSPGRLTVTAVI